MTEDKSQWSVSCQNGGCDFSKSGASADAANKAAQAHVDQTGHATITQHVVGVSAAQPAQVIEEPKAPAKTAAKP